MSLWLPKDKPDASKRVHACRSLHLLLSGGEAGEDCQSDSDFLNAIVSNTSQQVALLAAAAELVLFAATGNASFPALTARLQAMDSLMDFWHLLPYLQQAAIQANSLIPSSSNMPTPS